VSRRANLLVFDDYVPLSTTALKPVYTSVELYQALAQFDQMAIQVIIDNVVKSTTAGFQLAIQTGSSRHFTAINSAGTPEISIPSSPGLSTTTSNIAAGSYPGLVTSDRALLSFVRFAFWFTEATTAGHVKIYVTQRDQAQ
jgi:hypothetical protein